MNMKRLVDKYFNQIEIEDTDFVLVDGATSDAAYLLLNIPTAMLKEYSGLKCQNKELPDGAEFWKETGLVNRLRNSGKYHGQGHVGLGDILDYLKGDVCGEYQNLDNPEKIRLDITEIPNVYKNKTSFG